VERIDEIPSRRDDVNEGAEVNRVVKREISKAMTAVLIYALLVLAVAPVFIYYCRSAVATSKRIQLPARACEATGLGRDGVAPDDFERFLELVHLCPEESADQRNMAVVYTYYTLVHALERASRGLMPRVESWAQKEQRNCSHFAAVALDRRDFRHSPPSRPESSPPVLKSSRPFPTCCSTPFVSADTIALSR
jgi:hypothetical protein